MKILNPEREPNAWLEAIMLDLLQNPDEQAQDALKDAIHCLCTWIEPGLVDDLFAPWIDDYMKLLSANQNNQSIDPLPYLLTGQKESSPQPDTTPELDHPSKVA